MSHLCHRSRGRLAALSCCLLVAVAAAVACMVGSAAGAGGLAVNVTLLHTQSTYSAVLPVDAYNNPCVPINDTAYTETCFGGIARRAAYIKAVRAAEDNVVLVDAGDMLLGSLFYFRFGPSVIDQYYGEMAYDAVKLGVHDFIARRNNVADFVRGLSNTTRVVVSNIDGIAGDPYLGNVSIVRSAIIELSPSGERVGFVATVVQDLNVLFSDPGNVNSSNEATAMRDEVARLENAGVNKIVAAVSMPGVVDAVLASAPGIDVVVVNGELLSSDGTGAGPYPTVKEMPWGQRVLVVASGQFGQRIGHLRVEFDEYGVVLTNGSGDAVLLDDSFPDDPATQATIMAQYQEVLASASSTVGYTEAGLGFQTNCLFSECGIGDWAADVMRAYGGTQIGWTNGGGIRAGFPQGNVTLGDEQEAFPFGSATLYTYRLDGSVLLAALEHSVSLATDTWLDVNSGPGRFAQVSGLRFLWNTNETVGMRVVNAWVETRPGAWELVDPAANYTFTEFNWYMIGGDGFTMVEEGLFDLAPLHVTSGPFWLQQLATGPVAPVTTGRILTTDSVTRRTCLDGAGAQQLCSGNGYCLEGVCHCTTAGASGPYCIAANQTAGSSGGLSTGAVLGIVVSAVAFAVFVAAVVLAVAVFAGIAMRGTRRGDDEWLIDDAAEIERADLLGQGGYGEVHKATWRGTEVAVKTLPHEDLSRAAIDGFVDEARVMSCLRHPNIVMFMAACARPPTLCIVMEYMALGSLYDLLHNELIPDIPFALGAKLMFQAAKGMYYLHSSGVVHRDLKSLNMLLDPKWNLKISDFGLSSFKERTRRKGEAGSIMWMAPEVLADESEIDYVLADVYSFGIVMWEVLTRRELYEGLQQPQVAVGVIARDLRPPVPSGQTLHADQAQYVELMGLCWAKDPQKRPVFLDAMNELRHIVEGDGRSVVSGAAGGSSYLASGQHGHRSATSSGSSGGEPRPHDGPWSAGQATTATSSSSMADPLARMAPACGSPWREDVSFVVCDLSRFGRAWEEDAIRAERLVGHFEALVRGHAGKWNAYTFSTPMLQSGGTFFMAFGRAAEAASFALAIAEDARRHPDLCRHARTSVHHRPGPSRPAKNDPLGTSYDPGLYREACRLNVACPVGAVLCSDSFRELLAEKFAFRPFEDGHLLAPSSSSATDENGQADIERDPNAGHGRDGFDHDDYDDRDDDDRRHGEMELCSSNNCPWMLDPGRLYVGERIGEGSFGQVLKAKYDQMDVVVKRLYNSRLDSENLRRMRREAALLYPVVHPYLVQLIGLSVGGSNNADGIMLVMERVEGRSLRALLSDRSAVLGWSKKVAMLRDAALGIEHLHKNGFMHRDLKSSNLLVDGDGRVKVADFGFATAKQQNATLTRCGTPAWTPPELLDSKPKYDERADVYSFGIVMWEVLTRREPYEGLPMHEILMKVVQGERPAVPDDCPADFSKLMRRCWKTAPARRPTMEAVVVALNGQLDRLPDV